MNDEGPTRKLGRGISNMVYGITELPQTIALLNDREGNSSAVSYGIVKGVGRVLARSGYGLYEFLTFPFPSVKGSYRAPYRSNIPWIHGGFEEYPPELGFNTKYRYVRAHEGW